MNRSMFLAAGFVLALSSCSTIQHTSQVADVDTQVYNLTVADMNVSKQKQTVTTDWKWNPLTTVSLSAQKETATALLLNEAKADVLVEPQYIVKRRGLFRGGSLTVTGYPATYSNFRSMTTEDAEKLAKVNGKDGGVAVAYPVINTSANKFVKKIKKVKVQGERPARHQFVSLLGGPMIDAEGYLNIGYNLGAMYGNYGRSWGWYGKVSIVNAEYEYYHRGNDHSYSQTTALVTVGAVKTLSSNFSCLFGLGFGGYLMGDEQDAQYADDGIKAEAALPVELGFQWHKGHFNVMAGVTFAAPLAGDGSGNFSPFVGVGYNF